MEEAAVIVYKTQNTYLIISHIVWRIVLVFEYPVHDIGTDMEDSHTLVIAVHIGVVACARYILHEEVLESASQVEEKFKNFVMRIIMKM